MPELKHNFTGGKMNKDLDERLVPNGQYRDALNIQVRTTDGDGRGIGDSGTVQNIEGNENIAEAYLTTGYRYEKDWNTTRFVGSIANEKDDKAYFFAAAPTPTHEHGDWTAAILNVFEGVNLISSNQINEDDFPPDNYITSIAEIIPEVSSPQNFNANENYYDALVHQLYVESQSPYIKDTKKHWIDSIVQVNAKEESYRNLFVDKFAVTGRWIDVVGGEDMLPENFGPNSDYPLTPGFTELLVMDGSHYRIGMKVRFVNNMGQEMLFANGVDSEDGIGVEIINIQGNVLSLATAQQADIYGQAAGYLEKVSWQSAFLFQYPERVLEFDPFKLISSINIIDDLLFWTDGYNEPKKINIERSREGTQEIYVGVPDHTKLFVSDNEEGVPDLVEVEDMEWSIDTSDIKREHITVIRQAPTTAPTLFMRDSNRDGIINFNINYVFIDGENYDPAFPETGDERIVTLDQNYDIQEGDILKFTSADNVLDPVIISVRVIEIFGELVQGGVKVEILTVDPELSVYNPSEWNVELEQENALFETKFGRVGYRYKYEDGEYSTFSPWSELAFLPGNFSYTPSQGFNNGMENQLRHLVIKDFIPDDSIRPNDVKAIDLLWKTTDDQSVYIIKTVTRGRSNEWKNFDDLELENYGKTTITSEMINKVLSSDQLFRSWDNVPKSAITQEITANRLVYGNYKQGYNINKDVSLIQNVISTPVNFPTPKKSVKSIRNYKWGVVLGDRYGRETSVLVDGYESGTNQVITGDITVDKSLSSFQNKFKLKQDWQFPPNSILKWAEYAKYYVKETSNEYYNLILDRWYDSGDGNIWLSFPSVDRNKVDEETYLILKNAHGNQNPVSVKAKYKILAIESEAPDFIKTNFNTYERVEIDQLGIYGIDSGDADNSEAVLGEITNGIPASLINKNVIRTTNNNWEDVGIQNDDAKGQLEMRIVGLQAFYNIEAYSPWRDVSRLKTTGSRKGADISKVFESDDVNMYLKLDALLPEGSTLSQAAVDDDNAEDDYIKYYMEFRDKVVENHPQFDGRFFVKIEKDNILEEQVLNQFGGDYVNDGAAVNIAYIANLQYNPAQAGDAGSFGGQSWDDYGDNTDFTDSTIGLGVGTEFVDGAWRVPFPNPQNNINNNDVGPSGIVSAYSTNHWSDVTWNYIDYDNNPFNLHTDAVSSFGPGDPVATENFWNWWLNQGEGVNPARTANIFLDSAPAYDNFFISRTLDITYSSFDNWEGGGTYTFNEGLDLFGLPVNSFYIGTKDNYEQTGNPNQLSIAGGDLLMPVSLGQRGIFGPEENFWPANHAGFSGGTESCTSYHPSGLTQGLAQDGELGQMTLSMIGNDTGFGNGPEQVFKARMQTPGTYFRFTGDPLGNVYKVITNRENVPKRHLSGIDNGQGIDHAFVKDIEGPIEVDSINFPDDNVNNLTRKRHSIIVRFLRVEAGIDLDGTGVQPDQWDPRGQVKHNGLGHFGIQFLLPTTNGELLEDEILSNGACFETEPKEDLDVDIYYEASNAIPMRLKKDNIKSFVDSNFSPNDASKVGVDSRELIATDVNGNNILEPVNLDAEDYYLRVSSNVGNTTYPLFENPFIYTTIGNDIINLKNITSVASSQEVIDMPYMAKYQIVVEDTLFGTLQTNEAVKIKGVTIGDIISFTNSSGLVTRTQVLDHVLPIDSTGEYVWDVNAFDFTAYNSFDTSRPTTRYTVSDCEETEFVTNPVTSTILKFDSQGQLNQIMNNLEVGMEVIGDHVEKGTFIRKLEPVNPIIIFGQHKIHLNRPLLNTVELPTSFTFIKTTGWYQIDTDVYKYPVELPWFNCYSFGNGVESDRIRDDFNAPQIDNGIKVSSVFLEYAEEHIGSGLIHSSELFNATSSVNGLNQFSMAQKITKNLNPIYGSIQRLKTRDTDVVTFCEDKVLKVLANKDAIFNADGNTQLTATNRVLGQTIPFAGDYGISKNPESLAVDNYRMYFTDKQRGAVMRLSQDGLTPISNVGMKSYFREFLPKCENLVGTFDVVKGEYNLKLGINEINQTETICNETGCSAVAEPITLSFNEGGKGWVSFKSFMHSCGASVTGKYITAPTNKHVVTHKIWKHNSKDSNRNNFYGEGYTSTIDVLFNDQPDSIKLFKTMGYEGTKARILTDTQDNNYYNLQNGPGWYISSIITDSQTGRVPEFINKENKFYNYIVGEETTVDDMDTSDFSVQGIGYPLQIGATTETSTTQTTFTTTGGVNTGGPTTPEDNINTDTDTDSGSGVDNTGSDGIVSNTDSDGDGVVVGSDSESTDGQDDTVVEVEIENEETIDANALHIDEVIVMQGTAMGGDVRYNILAKVSGGSGDYRFKLSVRGTELLPSGLLSTIINPFPNGVNYNTETAIQNAEPNWATSPGSGTFYDPPQVGSWDTGGSDYEFVTTVVDGVSNNVPFYHIVDSSGMVPFNFDWSWGEYQFASHTQFPMGLRPNESELSYGIGSTNALTYSLTVFDNADVGSVTGTFLEGFGFPVHLDADGNYAQPSHTICFVENEENYIAPTPIEIPGFPSNASNFLTDGFFQYTQLTVLFQQSAGEGVSYYSLNINNINFNVNDQGTGALNDPCPCNELDEFIQQNNVTIQLLYPSGSVATIHSPEMGQPNLSVGYLTAGQYQLRLSTIDVSWWEDYQYYDFTIEEVGNPGNQSGVIAWLQATFLTPSI